MKSIGRDEDDKNCPQCRQFIINSDIIVQKMDGIERRIFALKDNLHQYEWTIIENATNIRNMRENGFSDIDKESFAIAFQECKSFLRLLENIESSLGSMERKYDDVNNGTGNRMGYV